MRRGFTLVETLVGVAVFVLIAASVYQAYAVLINSVRVARLKTTATALATEQFEIMRNLAYGDVGIVNGVPSGKIPHTQTLVRDGTSFSVVTAIRNIDDPFDGTIGGNPNDLSPADYKLAEVDISCPSAANFRTLEFTTTIAPRALESASTNGSLFVQAFDASGLPVAGADVHIENNQVFPKLVIDDVTNNAGLLQIVDVPPGVEAYEITVSKLGYSTDKTYKTGAPGNPNPIKPHATVVKQKLTQLGFPIDRTSTLNISSVQNNCSAVPNVTFALSGSKLIGTNPNVLKYSSTQTTDGFGGKVMSGLEWDAYNLALSDSSYDLAGTIPLLPLALNANSSQDLKLIVAPKVPDSLLVTVKDASTKLPLSGANVELQKTGYDVTVATGQGQIGTPPSCFPLGQAFFNGLAAGSYTITVSKAGYQTFTGTQLISLSSQKVEVFLSPQ
jgi:prepilin-type N-terminal cleavage/methylation domain-containing protein